MFRGFFCMCNSELCHSHIFYEGMPLQLVLNIKKFLIKDKKKKQRIIDQIKIIECEKMRQSPRSRAMYKNLLQKKNYTVIYL